MMSAPLAPSNGRGSNLLSNLIMPNGYGDAEDVFKLPYGIQSRRTRLEPTLTATQFDELYELTGEMLGRGAYASVQTCRSMFTGQEFAVKVRNVFSSDVCWFCKDFVET